MSAVVARPSPWRTLARILTFRASREELLALDDRHLALGLILTWIVGMGRYWDHPTAGLLQKLGVGSVIYVFVLSLLLWMVAAPLADAAASYRRILTFVTLTAPPAILYAFPIEQYTDLATARQVNVWFLAAVAAWRVALLAFFFRRLGGMTYLEMVIATLLPITAIVTGLTILNLERAVFDIMGGLGRNGGTASDEAYAVLVTLTFFSVLLFVPLLLVYSALVGGRNRDKLSQAFEAARTRAKGGGPSEEGKSAPPSSDEG